MFKPEDLAELDRSQVSSDYQLLLGNPKPAKGDAPFVGGAPGKQRDPARGFLSLRQEVVEALRGQDLRWGATDFPGASGDVMHFDDGNHTADYKKWDTEHPTTKRGGKPAAAPVPSATAEPAAAGTVQKKPLPGAIAASGAAPAAVDRVLAHPGAPLDGATRGFFESRLGRDLGAVRLHTDAPAAESAAAIGARAYTAGNRIVFGAGQFDPTGAQGRALLAHELVHVAQQAGGLAGAPDTLQRTPEENPAAPAPAAKPSAGLTVLPCGTLPRQLGLRGGCGRPTDTDFMAYDFPKLGTADSLKAAPFRALSDVNLQTAMANELVLLAQKDGLDATMHFIGGTGTKKTFAAGSNLGDLAAKSGSFGAAAEAVRSALNLAVSAQATTGTVDCSMLSLPAATLPRISFGFKDAFALKAVIGGTHGLPVNLLSFSMSPATLAYRAELEFVICDNFGVDLADLYSPSLLAFWVLQHERPGNLPYVNEIVLNRTFSDSI